MSASYGTVFRTRPLPRGPLQGEFILSGRIMAETRSALLQFAEAGADEGGHEGICYWAGKELPGKTTFEAVMVPDARHRRGSVFVSAAAYGAMSRRARRLGFGILAQIHSHPGADTRHSDGDDKLVIMPFEGMLSLVAPRYGCGLHTFDDFSVHQYQSKAWVLCEPESFAGRVSGTMST